MGDRRNVALHYDMGPNQEPSIIWLYTHWSGTGLEGTVQHSIARAQDRWQDPSYLARVIFTDMVSDHIDDLKSTTGFGMAPYEGDGEHPVIHVYLDQQVVVIGGFEWTFQEFADATLRQATYDYS